MVFQKKPKASKNILPCKKLIQHGFRGNLVQTSSFVAAQNKTCTKKIILKFVLKKSQITKHSSLLFMFLNTRQKSLNKSKDFLNKIPILKNYCEIMWHVVYTYIYTLYEKFQLDFE